MKFRLIIILSLLNLTNINGQTHQEFWSKLSVSKKISSSLTISLDFQLRQQADFKYSSKNIFELPNTRATRIWLHYNINNNFNLFITPIAFFRNDEMKNFSNNLNTTHELRWGFGIAKSLALKKTILKSRFFFETRYINNTLQNNLTQHRYRWQNSLSISLKKTKNNCDLNYLISNEFFIKTQQNQTSFDQNRVQNMIQIKLSKFDINLGYQFTIQNMNNTVINRNQFLLSYSLEI